MRRRARRTSISRVEVEWGPGLTLLTGETGAGKSIIIDAVSTLLGGRAESEYIRAGTDESRVEGIFHLNEAMQASILPLLKEDGLEGEDSIRHAVEWRTIHSFIQQIFVEENRRSSLPL